MKQLVLEVDMNTFKKWRKQLTAYVLMTPKVRSIKFCINVILKIIVPMTYFGIFF